MVHSDSIHNDCCNRTLVLKFFKSCEVINFSIHDDFDIIYSVNETKLNSDIQSINQSILMLELQPSLLVFSVQALAVRLKFIYMYYNM